jgi:methionyl aminopeptidase
LDQQVGELIRAAGASSAFSGYRGFPRQCCLSVNEAVIHGLGNERRLQFGDVVKLDVGVRVGGFVGDVAMTMVCGGSTPQKQRLLDTTAAALWAGIGCVAAGRSVGDLGRAVQAVVEKAGYGVVREFCGHGVGRSVHEEPQIPNYYDEKLGRRRLKAGMVFAIEPMVTAGAPAVEIANDGWTVLTKDRSLSAHFEHTVLVTDGGCEVLTIDGAAPLY